MLQIRPSCEHCDKALPPNATDAMICSFECTFCATCVQGILMGVCPNCGYAAARLIGPARSETRPTLYANEKISVGLTLQAPNVYYLPHRHKAVEFYKVLGGTEAWEYF